MIHRLFDVLMQDAWSLTAFVIRRRAKTESALYSLSVVLSLYQTDLPSASMKLCSLCKPGTAQIMAVLLLKFCFDLRFGERESEAQAQRRTERRRSGMTGRRAAGGSTPILRHCVDTARDERVV
jgi:hypothetical protein